MGMGFFRGGGDKIALKLHNGARGALRNFHLPRIFPSSLVFYFLLKNRQAWLYLRCARADRGTLRVGGSTDPGWFSSQWLPARVLFCPLLPTPPPVARTPNTLINNFDMFFH